MRLLSVVYRTLWAAAPSAATQLIKHGHILVNYKVITVAEYKLTVGTIIKIRNFRNVYVQAAIHNKERTLPSFLEVIGDTCKVISNPSIAEPDFKAINFSTVFECYR